MNFLNFFLLFFAQYILGWSVLRAAGFKDAHTSLQYSLVAEMIGVGLFCLFPVMLEMMSVTINITSVTLIIIAACAVPAFFWLRSWRGVALLPLLKSYAGKIRLVDLVFIGVFIYIAHTSIFKCAYYPPQPRDLTSGAEAIAEYTIREGHMNNSYFSIDLSSTDNYQKPPFLLGLQIVYKLLVQPFGQVWLLLLSLPFIALFYLLGRKIVHPLIAALFTILLLITPEFFAYVLILPLYDFANTAYLFVAFYYLWRFLQNSERKFVLLSAAGFGLATMVRPETLLLVGLVAFSYYLWQTIQQRKLVIIPALFAAAILLLVPVVFDVFTMEIFIKHFLPSSLDIGNKFNPDLSNFEPLSNRVNQLINYLMFPTEDMEKAYDARVGMYAQVFNFLLFFIIIEVIATIIVRKINLNALYWFVFMVLVFALLCLVGYLLVWTEYTNAKRGLFKLLPLIFFFGMNTRAIQFITEKMNQWERTKI